jgi:uncharacterized protein (DUF1330 family)
MALMLILREARMAQQLPPGIAPSRPVTTFDERVAQINATPALFENLARQPDDWPIIILNFLRYRPRADASMYHKYAVVAGREIEAVGGAIVQHSTAATGTDTALAFSDDWDGMALARYPRRASYIELQTSTDYQTAIADRVAGTFARLLYVLSDDKPIFDATTSIAELHKSDKQVDASPSNLVVSELAKFRDKDGSEHFGKWAKAVEPLIKGIGGEVFLSVRAELPIVSQQNWDHFTLIRYPSLDAYEQLTKTDDWQAAGPLRLVALERHLAVPGIPQLLPG